MFNDKQIVLLNDFFFIDIRFGVKFCTSFSQFCSNFEWYQENEVINYVNTKSAFEKTWYSQCIQLSLFQSECMTELLKAY